ncbi:hypothetical protein D6D19_04664 [Aureobasidium pullulans]|uniref:Uncharacterized protein n=1 Tax=Aureobasidium pullulans TaxID=5580 RepID=A0A4S9A6A3_AURPU|nr:hypothetical protein D6D19_04664 [Aureobasidium pullulans]
MERILEALKALGTQLEVVSTRLQALEVRLTVAPTADGASCIESDDRLPYHHVGDGGHVTPTQASPEVDGGFTIATPAANHAAFDQPALAQANKSALVKKRKRADSPELDQSGRTTAPGFQMRDSATQIEESTGAFKFASE